MFKPGDRIRWRGNAYEAVVVYRTVNGTRNDDKRVVFQFTCTESLQVYKTNCVYTDAVGNWTLIASHDPFNQVVADYCSKELGRG